MDQIKHLLKQNDSNSKIAGLILAINYLKNESKNNVEQDLETIYQSMGRKFLFKLLSSPLFINNTQNNNELQINATSITCYQVAISITKAMINNPSINNQIIAGIVPLLSNIIAQIITIQKQNKHKNNILTTLNALNNSIIDCTFMILQCYHNYNKNKNNLQKLIKYYIVSKSNHYNQKNAENANVYSMTMSFLKCLSLNQQKNDDEEKKDEKKDSETNVFDQHKKIIKIIEFLILNCFKPNNQEHKSLIITQNIFIKTLMKLYKQCQTKLKFEFPKLILSIFYHLFGEKILDINNNNNNDILNEYLVDIKNICISSLASRMYIQHRLDIFKLIQMSLFFEKHKWFIMNTEINKMNSEKLFLFVLSSVCNEIQSTLEIPLWEKNKSINYNQYDVLNTNLNIFDKLLSYIISEKEEIDAFISTFSSKTMHSIQENIHNVIRSLFYYMTELKYAVFEKNNDIGLKKMNANKKKTQKSVVDEKLEVINNKFKSLSLNDILNDECYKLLDRILCSITLYMNNDFKTFTDEFCGILAFILHQFDDKYLCIICNVLSKMLTNDISESKENDKKYKKMIIKELYVNDYLFDIAIKKKLNELALKLTSGYKQELSELFELENEFLSIALLIHDVFVFKNNTFISKLFKEDNINNCQFETLINMVCRIGMSKETQEIILPLLFVILRTINKTANKKLDKFVKNGIKIHIPNLIKIANACQQYEHAWLDDIAMDIMQLTQNFF